MKVLSRDFTAQEKILIVVLSLILCGLCYYKFVDLPVRNGLEEARIAKENAEIELIAVNSKINSLQKMKDEIDFIESSDSVSIMPSYNNEKKELTALNNILSKAIEYNIQFTGMTREGDQIRRNFSLNFVAGSVEDADAIVTGLYGNKDRCLIGDLTYQDVDESRQVYNSYGWIEGYRSDVEAETDDISKGKVSVTMTATFYETMVGGVEDDVLPPDSAAKQTVVQSEEDLN